MAEDGIIDATVLDEIRDRIEQRQRVYDSNVGIDQRRPDESHLRKLDSNLKKNTTFVRKLKILCAAHEEALVNDFLSLNLSKYVEEMASSLVEAKLKMTDVPCALRLAVMAHQRYATFATEMYDQWRRILPTKKSDKIVNASKLRVDIRFYADLVLAGVFAEKEGMQMLGATLVYITQTDKTDHQNVPIIAAFCRYCGLEFAGIVPRSIRIAADRLAKPIPKCTLVSAERRQTIANLLGDYYTGLVEHVRNELVALQRQERRNRRQYETKGEVYAEDVQRLEECRTSYEKIYQAAVMLAEYVDREPPPSITTAVDDECADDELTMDEHGVVIRLDTGVSHDTQSTGSGALWEDDDTRQFYESLVELRVILPGILYKDSEEATLAPVADKIDEVNVDEEIGDDTNAADTKEDTFDDDDIESTSVVVDEDASAPDESSATISGSTWKLMMQAFVQQLPNLVNRDLIDNAAVDFVTNLNTKTNRKRLVQALFEVPRTRLDLLPFYGRLVATLQPVMPDLGTELVQLLIAEFRRHMRKKNQLHIESKLRCVRFIGELVKFRVFPKSEALHCLRMLLFDFRHHNIDMACALLDTAGYYLHRSADSHQKTKLLLELMMRKRQQLAGFDQRYQMMIDNAFFTCDPPPAPTVQRAERPPMHEYIRRQLFRDLGKSTSDRVLRQMRKIDWSDENVSAYAIRCMTSPWMLKYSAIPYLASVLAGIMWYHDWVGMIVVDALLEDIRIGLEINHPRLNQRRIACLRYLGEMYNYRVCDSAIIFKQLYLLITFGVNFNAASPTPYDPPEHLFRIRLACVLLDTCGEYFDNGSSKKKLDCYLVYLQRYYWFKRSLPCWTNERPFPLEAKNLMDEIFEMLRPKLKQFTSLAEAENGVRQIDDEYREKVESALKFVDSGADDDECADDEGGLRPIAEEEECDDERQLMSGPDQSQDLSDTQGTCLDEIDDDDEVHVHKNATKRGPEDDDFLSAFDRMLADSLQIRMKENVQVPNAELIVPSGVRARMLRKTNFADEQGTTTIDNNSPMSSTALCDEGDRIVGEPSTTMPMLLMTKGKGSKSTLKTVKIAVDDQVVQAWRQRQQDEDEEKRKLKQLTLDMTRRMEFEELEDAVRNFATVRTSTNRGGFIGSTGATTAVTTTTTSADGSAGKGAGSRFTHQKGAPTSTQLFSSTWK